MYDPATYVDPTEPTEDTYEFSYDGKALNFINVKAVSWKGRKTLAGMEKAKVWKTEYGTDVLEINPELLDDIGVYWFKELAFPG